MTWTEPGAEGIFLDLLKERGLHPGVFNAFPLRNAFFKSITRPWLLFPQNLSARLEADDRYPEKQKILLAFSLPRGSYATLVVKRLFAEPPGPKSAGRQSARLPRNLTSW
jgi:tRNA pseudouridine13 synthase